MFASFSAGTVLVWISYEYRPRSTPKRTRRMFNRRGITLIELVVALVVGGILMGIAVNSFGGVQARNSVRSAEAAFRSLHGQARAFAVERGERVVFVVDSGQNQVSLVAWRDGAPDTLRSRNFVSEFNTQIESQPSLVELCMSPRGFGEVACNSFTSPARVIFTRAGEERALRLLPLGQVDEG